MEAQNENDMTRHEWEVMLKELKKVFSIVRLLNEEELRTGRLQGSTDMSEGCECYALWNKNSRCDNCISRAAFAEKGKRTKLEFIDDGIFQVVSKYIKIDGVPYVAELVNKLDGDALVSKKERDEMLKKLIRYDRELYMDALTGAYNRRYSTWMTLSFIMILMDIMQEILSWRRLSRSYETISVRQICWFDLAVMNFFW